MMEFSSPLAAMHPPPCPAWGLRRDLPTSRPAMYSSQTYSGNSFNFKELSMKRTSTDYFTLKPARGSSPTSSLAADLSSNFHIDQSPQIPTPRRSLFNANFLLPRNYHKDHLVTPPIDYEGATTPPIPSSSPGGDMMDISPLPHKLPFVAINVTLPSPSPEPTPDEDDDTFSYSVSRPNSSDMGVETLAIPTERKFSRRPGLVRNKGYSTTSIPQKANNTSDSQLPTFRFGSGVPTLAHRSSLTSLDECFDSPSADRKPVSMNFPFYPSSRRTSIGRNSGSPLTSHIKKGPSATRVPPRKQVRRSLSMFQHPDDIMKDNTQDYQLTCSPPMAMDLDETYKHKLPHFVPVDEPDSLPRIQQDTLLNILNGNYNSHYDQIHIVDCRFEYEYNGGHIDGALNFNNKEELADKLFESDPSSRTLLIFHCEYSELRAPRMAKFVRNRDRAVNDFQYPKLTYPEMYILDGGYSKFFANHRTKCFPQNYVEMQDKDHEQECEKGLGKLKQRAKLNRAQTFAFGQQSCSMEDSPTAGARIGSHALNNLDLGSDYNNSPLSQTLFRRQLSY